MSTVTPLAAICLLNSSATMAPLPYLEACRYSIFIVTPLPGSSSGPSARGCNRTVGAMPPERPRPEGHPQVGEDADRSAGHTGRVQASQPCGYVRDRAVPVRRVWPVYVVDVGVADGEVVIRGPARSGVLS